MAFKTLKTIQASAQKALLGASLVLATVAAAPAFASTEHGTSHTGHHTSATHKTSYHHSSTHHHATGVHTRHSHYIHHTRSTQYRHSRLQCVPYAREISHISITGNAYLWWAKAAGRYARGSMPEQGAVLNFRAIGRMPLGHVAVVTGVIDSRTIIITQANWIPGTITNDVTVQDVSADNDWSEVKVELGDSSRWGAPYPTYGFIYNRPAIGTVIASNHPGTEVAEAPPVKPVGSEAPNRNLQ